MPGEAIDVPMEKDRSLVAEPPGGVGVPRWDAPAMGPGGGMGAPTKAAARPRSTPALRSAAEPSADVVITNMPVVGGIGSTNRLAR